MSKTQQNKFGPGSPDNPAHSHQPQAGHSTVGQQLPVGLLTRRQLAQRWNCCPHTVARRPDLQPVRLGPRLVRYRLAEIQEIEAAAVAATTVSTVARSKSKN